MCRALGSLGPIGLPVSRPSLLHPLFSLCPCSPVLPFVLRALTPNGNLPSLGFHRPAQVPRFLLSSQQLTIQWSTPTTWLSNIVVITPLSSFFFIPLCTLSPLQRSLRVALRRTLTAPRPFPHTFRQLPLPPLTLPPYFGYVWISHARVYSHVYIYLISISIKKAVVYLHVYSSLQASPFFDRRTWSFFLPFFFIGMVR